MEAIFSLEQGITSPRDGSVNWSPYESYATAADAKREARKAVNKNALWRVVKVEVIWQSDAA